MRTLDRWILKRFVLTYLAFALSVLLIYFVTDVLNRLERFRGDARDRAVAAATEAAKPNPPPAEISIAPYVLPVVRDYYGALMPEIYYMLAPFVTLVAAMWVLFELRRSNEMTPLLAAGVSPVRIACPLFVAAALLAGVMWADRELLMPRLAEVRREAIKFRRDWVIPNPVPDRHGGLLSARFYRQASRSLVEARYTHLDEAGRETICAVASTAVFEKEKDGRAEGWLFQDGLLVTRDPDGLERLERIPPGGKSIATDVRPLDIECTNGEALGYQTADELRRQLDRLPGLTHVEVQLARRKSYPCSSVILLFLGFPFVLRGDKTAAALGLLACLAVCAAFFVTQAFCEDMGARPGAPVSPTVAAWIPNIAFGLPGLLIFLKGAR